VQRLRASEDGCQRLQGHARDIFIGCCAAERLLGLRVETHQASAVVFRAEAIFHQAYQILRAARYLRSLKEVVVRVKEEAETRAEVVDVKSAPTRPFTYSTPS